METLRFIMTTTFYPPYHVGGDAIHVYHLSNELEKRGHEVHVVHLLDSYYFKRKNDPRGKHDTNKNVFRHAIKCPSGTLSLFKTYVFGKSVYIDRKVKSIIEGVKPDVINHHNLAGYGPSILRYEAPNVLYTAHDYWLICPMNILMKRSGEICEQNFNCALCSLLFKRPVQLWRYRKNIKNFLDNIDFIIAPSNFLKEKLERTGINKDIKVMPNFVLSDTKSNSSYRSNIKAKNIQKPYILYVGVLEPYKGILMLLDTFQKIQDNVNLNMVVVGNGSLYKKLKSIKSKKILLNGWVDQDELKHFYKNAEAVVIPSLCHENNPFVALESLKYGTPIIVSDRGGLPEIAQKGDMPVFKSSSELKSLLEKLDRGELIHKNPQRVYEDNYSPDSFIEKYLCLIRDK